MKVLSILVTYLGDVVSPLRCAACDERLNQRAFLCATCAGTVERWVGTDGPLALGRYGGALAQAILRLKYGSRPDLGPLLGLLVCSQLLEQLEPWKTEVVIPVPVPASRLVQRGYNQSALIARPIARALNARFAPRALVRAEGLKQASLGRKERLRNPMGAFEMRQPTVARGRRILLVDDVSTTGATLVACEQALTTAGAAIVHSVVVARAEAQERGTETCDRPEIGS